MVEGARLESVYRGNSIEGSNPFLSVFSARRSVRAHSSLVVLSQANVRKGFERAPLRQKAANPNF